MNLKIVIKKILITPVIVASILLLIPLIALQFYEEFNWTFFDFLIAWILFFVTGFIYKFSLFKANNIEYKIASATALLTGLLLIWVNFAVGIIGSEENPINTVYFLVILIGIIGSSIASFNAKGMSLTMFFMAGAMGIILISLLIYASLNFDKLPGLSVWGLISFHAFFIVIFAASGILFRNSTKIVNTK